MRRQDARRIDIAMEEKRKTSAEVSGEIPSYAIVKAFKSKEQTRSGLGSWALVGFSLAALGALLFLVGCEGSIESYKIERMKKVTAEIYGQETADKAFQVWPIQGDHCEATAFSVEVNGDNCLAHTYWEHRLPWALDGDINQWHSAGWKIERRRLEVECNCLKGF